MNIYRCKTPPFSGTRYAEVAPQARRLLRHIASRTKRQPYVRSAYFRKDKIFMKYFWEHLTQKNLRDQARRLKYLPCGVELIRKSTIAPYSYKQGNRSDEIFHRFMGRAPDGTHFAVQIKEHQRNGQREFMSVFPIK